MHLFVHKERHIVISRTDLPETGEVLVAHVSVAPNVPGASRRGRKPSYNKVPAKVKVAELTPFTGDLTEVVKAHAESQLALLPEVATETTPDAE